MPSLPKQIVLATGNQGKLREMQKMLAGLQTSLHSQSEFGVQACPENGLSFIENAILKAQNAARQTGLAAIADDSGIVVDALDGAPGVFSARYAGPDASDEENLQKLLSEFKRCGVANPKARFVCVIAFILHEKDPLPMVFQGIWEGEIICEPRGDNGFGYDPIFWLPERACTSAELSPEVKNNISHRAQAVSKLVEGLAAKLP